VRELTFSARVFAYASNLQRVQLENVTAWYDGLRLGTRQLAESAEAIALFQLLQLARREEDEEESIRRLAIAASALAVRHDRLFALRTTIAPVIHPMHDDALDPRVEDATREWIEVADEAGSAVIRALQQRIASS
jgi:hypothetical protein